MHSLLWLPHTLTFVWETLSSRMSNMLLIKALQMHVHIHQLIVWSSTLLCRKYVFVCMYEHWYGHCCCCCCYREYRSSVAGRLSREDQKQSWRLLWRRSAREVSWSVCQGWSRQHGQITVTCSTTVTSRTRSGDTTTSKLPQQPQPWPKDCHEHCLWSGWWRNVHTCLHIRINYLCESIICILHG